MPALRRARLATALDAGALALPVQGRLIAFGVGGDTDLTGFPADRTDIVQPLRPDHDRLAARGFRVLTEPPTTSGAYAAALVHPERAREAARLAVGLAERLVVPGGPVIAEGAKTDGIDSLFKAVRAQAAPVGTLTRAHGRVFWFAAGAAFVAWVARGADWPMVADFRTAPGVFSADRVDPGSAALAAALPAALPGCVADLGAGWGYLSRAILARGGVVSLDLVEADHRALSTARENVQDDRARCHWADATSWRPESPLDWVVMNPPFHAGRASDPSVGLAFIGSAARILRPGGGLWLVANRHLPYERGLAEGFREIGEVAAPAGFKILTATQPRRRGFRPG